MFSQPHVQIMQAMYGAQHSWSDVTQALAQHVAGKGPSVPGFRYNSVFGDPLPHTRKQLKVVSSVVVETDPQGRLSSLSPLSLLHALSFILLLLTPHLFSSAGVLCHQRCAWPGSVL